MPIDVYDQKRTGFLAPLQQSQWGKENPGAINTMGTILDPGGWFQGSEVMYDPAGIQMDLSQANQIRDRQMRYLDTMQQAMAGRVPSAAERTLNRGADRAVSAASSLAASNPNVGPAASQRTAALAQNQAVMDAAQQSSILRAQEMERARMAMQQALHGVRGQDLSTAEANAGFRMEEERMGLENAWKNAGFGEDQKAAGQQGLASVFAMFSDENLKTDVEDAEEDLGTFLDAIQGKRFKYRDEKHGEGEHTGFMAQDIEKTRVGKAMVIDTDEGKAIDIRKAVMSALAGLGDVNRRLRAVEG